jgi:hypothetical protein
VAAVMLLVLAGSATAQAPAADKPIKFGNVEVSGSLRVRAESWDWFDTSAANDSYWFGGTLLRLSLKQSTSKVDWQVEGVAPWLMSLPTQSTAPAPQGALGLGANYFASNGEHNASGFVKQAFVRFKNLPGEGNSFRLGRFEFNEGAETAPKDANLAWLKRERISQRLIGGFGFSHVGRSFDGAQFVHANGANNLTLMGARATRGVFDVHGWDELDVDVIYGAFTRAINAKRGAGEWRVFGMQYHDGRGTVKTDNRPLAVRQADKQNIRLGTFGGNIVQTFKTGGGTADVLAWGAWQFGRWGALDHNAGALALEAGYQFDVRWKLWLRGGWFRSTGDGDAGDGEHGSFFQMLPTPRIYARFPFYNLMNSNDAWAGITLKPHARLALRSEFHHLRLADARDLWYQGGGAYDDRSFGYAGRPSNGSQGLAALVDVAADIQVTKVTSFTLYFAHAAGKDVVEKIYPEGAGANYGYLELNWRF